MKKKKSWPFFAVAIVILAAAYLTFFGVHVTSGDTTTTYIKGASEIRWGIDIRGGVDATFVPSDGYDATEEEMNAASEVIRTRLVTQGITDYEVYTDTAKDRIIVRFPWQAGETEYDPEQAIKELGDTAMLTFREGLEIDAEGKPTGKVVLEGRDLISAVRNMYSDPTTGSYQYVVSFKLSPEGTTKFAEATRQNQGKTISIWMDDTLISYPSVDDVITSGEGMISGGFTSEQAEALAQKIQGGALPFRLDTRDYSSISPTLGQGAKDVMVQAGMIAFVLVALYMVLKYRLPGFVGLFALTGQMVIMVASVTRLLPDVPSFTLTLPGIAGIILSIGMGVDANIITAERIREEIRSGKTIDGSVRLGFDRAFSAILDGNVTNVIVAVILMGAFGPANSIFSKIFFLFGQTTTGAIYSFGYTLLMGVVANMIMGVYASKAMLKGISRLGCFRDPWFYGGSRKEAEAPAQEKKSYDFVGRKKIFFAISAALVAIALVTSFVPGVELDIQFKGGSIVSYSYQGDVDMDRFQRTFEDAVGGKASIQQGEDIITGTKSITLSLAQDQGISAEVQQKATDALQAAFPSAGVAVTSVTNVDATIGREFFQKCSLAVAFAVLLMILYIAMRFKVMDGWSAGVMAALVLLHDVIVVYATFVIFGFPINENFIAVALTILGYSINATIVIYDRIRENRKLLGEKLPFGQLVNLSVNQSLGRAAGTSFSTILAMVVVAVMGRLYGLTSIVTFAFPLIMGLVAGLYSSVCLAGPLWVFWQESREKAKK